MSRLDQLCVLTDEISQDFKHALDVIADYGVKSVDLRKIWNKNIALFTNDELEELKSNLQERNLKVAVITGPIGKCLMPGARFATSKKKSLMRNPEYNLSLFDRLIEIADFFDTPYIRIFSFITMFFKPKKARWQKMKDLLSPIIEKAEQLNKVLLLENDLGMNVATIEETKRFFKEFSSDSVKLILDPGNYYMEREPTTPEAYEYFYDHNLVGHFHIKDPKHKIPFMGATFGVVGEGKIDYETLLSQAIDKGYKGLFSLETHALRKKEHVSKKSLENLAQWLEHL